MKIWSYFFNQGENSLEIKYVVKLNSKKNIKGVLEIFCIIEIMRSILEAEIAQNQHHNSNTFNNCISQFETIENDKMYAVTRKHKTERLYI